VSLQHDGAANHQYIKCPSFFEHLLDDISCFTRRIRQCDGIGGDGCIDCITVLANLRIRRKIAGKCERAAGVSREQQVSRCVASRLLRLGSPGGTQINSPGGPTWVKALPNKSGYLVNHLNE